MQCTEVVRRKCSELFVKTCVCYRVEVSTIYIVGDKVSDLQDLIQDHLVVIYRMVKAIWLAIKLG